MVKYTLAKLEDEPIVVASITADFKPTTDVQDLARDINTLFDALDERAYLILDRTNAAPNNMEDITVGAKTMGRTSGMAVHHPNLIQVVLVTSEDLVRRAFQGMASDMYGNVKSIAVETLDEALTIVRAL